MKSDCFSAGAARLLRLRLRIQSPGGVHPHPLAVLAFARAGRSALWLARPSFLVPAIGVGGVA